MRNFVLILFLLVNSCIHAQGIRDSMFTIRQVDVNANREFEKEQAGLTEIRIDTAIMQYQLTSDLSVLLNENSTIIIKDYGRGALSTASFRGTAPSHTQVTWNGININSPMLGMVDFSLVPMFIADELTIQHGAASVASQSGGLGGLIAIENIPVWPEKKMSGKAYAGFGSFGTSGVYTRINAGTRRFSASTRIYSSHSQNNYPFINKNRIEKDSITGALYHPMEVNRNAAYRKTGLTQEFYLKLPRDVVVSNRTWVQGAMRSVPTVLSNEFSEETLNRENRQYDRSVKNVTEFRKYGAQTKILMRTGFDYQQLDYSMLSEVVGFEKVRNVNSGSRMFSWYNRLQADHDFSDKFSAKLLASVNRHHISTYDTVHLTGYDKTRLESSLFGGVYYAPFEKLNLSLQLRKDFTNRQQVPLVYASGLTFRLLDAHQLYLKTNFSKNYHIPTLNDLYWQPGGNPDLKAEKGYTTEAGMVYQGGSEILHIKTSLTGFRTMITDWILWLPGFKGFWEPVNIDRVRSAGLEYHLRLTADVRNTHFGFHGNFAWTRTQNYMQSPIDGSVSYGRQLPFIPELSGNINISAENNGYFIIYQNNSMSERFLLSSNTTGINRDQDEQSSSSEGTTAVSLYPHYLNNLTIGKTLEGNSGNLTLELKIDNLLNETYRNILQRFMPGRSWYLNLKFDF